MQHLMLQDRPKQRTKNPELDAIRTKPHNTQQIITQSTHQNPKPTDHHTKQKLDENDILRMFDKKNFCRQKLVAYQNYFLY